MTRDDADRLRTRLAMALLLAVVPIAAPAQATQAPPAAPSTPSGAVPVAAAPGVTDAPAVDVLVTSPVHAVTELQVICLFRSSPHNRLAGALASTDSALAGLLTALRGPTRFAGVLGETLVLTPPPGTMPARRLLLIGLGDAATFTPARMRLIGRVLVREADRMGVTHPFFAPAVLDGGVTRYPTGPVAEQVVLGVRDAYRMAQWLAAQHANTGPKVTRVTYLAGAPNRASTTAGIQKALADTSAAAIGRTVGGR